MAEHQPTPSSSYQPMAGSSEIPPIERLTLNDPAAVPAPTACPGPSSCSGSGVPRSAVTLSAFPAVVDIEDLKFVSICGIRRPRPPIVPYLCSFRVQLEVGKTYRFCTCGRSTEQPFCDDTHTDDDPQPIPFQVRNKQSFWSLCGCKYSLQMPFCDGSHIHAVDGYEEDAAAAAAAAARATPQPPS